MVFLIRICSCLRCLFWSADSLDNMLHLSKSCFWYWNSPWQQHKQANLTGASSDKEKKNHLYICKYICCLTLANSWIQLIFYYKRSEDFTKWYMYKFIGILQVVLIVFFLAFWAIALSRVHSKLKLTGQTPPKKRIFIAHFVLVTLFILSTITSNLVFYYYNGKAWMYYTFWIT